MGSCCLAYAFSVLRYWKGKGNISPRQSCWKDCDHVIGVLGSVQLSLPNSEEAVGRHFYYDLPPGMLEERRQETTGRMYTVDIRKPATCEARVDSITRWLKACEQGHPGLCTRIRQPSWGM